MSFELNATSSQSYSWGSLYPLATLTTRNTGANGAGFAINYLNSDEIKKMSIPASPPTIVPLMRMN